MHASDAIVGCYEVNPQTTDPALIDAFSRFLNYGPIGLAGLMLVLAIVGLSVRNLTETRERLLRTFLYVGAFCFIAALGFQAIRGRYELSLMVYPNDLDGSVLPPPATSINGTKIDKGTKYTISSDITAVVDVTRAFDLAKAASQELQQKSDFLRLQADALGKVSQAADQLNAQIGAIPSTIAQNCPGGGSGVDASSNGKVLEITRSSLTLISDIKTAAASGLK